MNGEDYLIGLDKPPGPTSHQSVAQAREALRERRIGHCGTLDPFASGLLVLCVGRATRLVEFMVGLDKTYLATARLGVQTDTHDSEGTVVAESERWRKITPKGVEEALDRLRGEILQRPPRYSAKKVRGTAAHRRARRGEAVELQPVAVKVSELTVTGWDPPSVTLRVSCSSGTYVRALARDLGKELAIGAHLTALRRTRVGEFDVAQAITPDDLAHESAVEGARIGPLEALSHLPLVDIGEDDATELSFGRPIRAARQASIPAGPVRLSLGGRLAAIAEVTGPAGRAGPPEGPDANVVGPLLRPRKVFLA